MKRRHGFSLVALSAAVVLFIASSPTSAGRGTTCASSFARLVAGSYLMETTLEGEPPDPSGVTLLALVKVGADGTMTSEDQSDYGAFHPPAPAFESNNRGAWRRTGRREVTFNAIGLSYGPDGLPAGTGRLYGTLRFNRSFSGFQGEGVHELFLPGQDPLDPDSVPMASLPWSTNGRRIPAILR
jgi:hypothetical protein